MGGGREGKFKQPCFGKERMLMKAGTEIEVQGLPIDEERRSGQSQDECASRGNPRGHVC